MMPRTLGRWFCWAALAFTTPALAQLQACPPGVACADNLSAADIFAIADRYLAAGDLDAAATLLEGLTRDPGDDIRAEARFRLSQLRESRGDTQGAIDALRALLDEKPDAQRPRLELARLLATQGDESGARRELRRAGSAGLPEDVARVVDQFTLALRSSRPFGGSLEVAIAPDSNINRATRRETIDTALPGGVELVLDEDARAQSGIGVTIGGQGFWRADVSNDVAILTRLSARADLYGKSRFNDITASLVSGPEFRWLGARWRPAGVASRRWFGGDRYSDSLGVSLNVVKPLDRTSQIELEATVLDVDYRLVPGQDGRLFDLSFAYDRAFSPRTSGRITARYTRQTAVEPALATRGGGVEALVAHQIGRQLVYLQGGVSRLEADAQLALFPAIRRDTRYDLTGGLVLREFTFRNLAPLIRVTRSINQSTVGIYDFKRTRVEFAFSREF